MKRTIQTRPSYRKTGFRPLARCELAVAAAILLGWVPATYASRVVPIAALASAPVVDGQGDDWGAIDAVQVPLRKIQQDHRSEVDSVTIKGGVHKDRVYFYLTWKDATENNEHKYFVWDEQQGRYVQSKALEDRAAIQFAMSGDYTTDWLSGNSFTADMWHWKAFRSNTVGLVHDKQTIISEEKLLRSYEGKTAEGKPVYILRPSDSGDRLYKSQRYREREQDKMPKYAVTASPQGSVADIQAKGVWRDGAWHLEITRKLDTGNPDDVAFQLGQGVRGGIAIFNGTGDDDHTISDTLLFQF